MVTKDRKLEAVLTTLTILLPRLEGMYYGDIEACIKLLKEVREELSNGENNSGGDGGEDNSPSEQN